MIVIIIINISDPIERGTGRVVLLIQLVYLIIPLEFSYISDTGTF